MSPESPRSTSQSTSPTYASRDVAVGVVASVVGGTVEAVYDYLRADGSIAFAVVRLRTAKGKTFRPISPSGAGWRIGDPDGLLCLFNLPGIASAKEVVVVEGEKCVIVANQLRVKATTSAHGAKSAQRTDWTPLAGKNVVLMPDNDDAGLSYVSDVAAILRGLNPPAKARLLVLPDLPPGGDIVDWCEAKRAAGAEDADISEDLAKLIDRAEPVSDSAYSAYSARGGADANWEQPLPIVSRVALPPFPIETAFPSYLGRLRDFALAVAETYQVPVDAVAMCLLPTMALTLAKRFEVEPQPGWTEQLSIYTVSLMPSGDRKSAVIRCILRPVYAWQRDKATGLDAALAQSDNELFAAEEKLKTARKKLVSGEELGDDADDLARCLRELQKSVPRAPRLIATEGTSEAIALMLVENNERGMVAAAEGDALDVMLGRYSGSPNFGVWLSGHAGDAVDSIRRGRNADRLNHPALQVALCIQPDAVLELIGSRAAERRGLLARIFFVLPESKVGYRRLTPPPIPVQLSDFYGTRIQSHLDKEVPNEPTLIRLTTEASDILLRFREQNEVDLRPDGALGLCREWGSKLSGNLVRIAGIFAAFEHPEKPVIDVETMRCALSLAPYLTSHYEHIVSLASDDGRTAIARRIDGWIRKTRITIFSRRDAFTALRSMHIKKVEDIDPALDLLQARQRIRQLPQSTRGGPGRPASPQYEVNPFLHKDGPDRNSQNQADRRKQGADPAPPGPERGESSEGGAPHNTHNTQNPTLALTNGERRRRRGPEGDEWYTPSHVVELARAVLGEIDLDPASNPIAQLRIRAERYFTKTENGLLQPWHGRLFINPPYSHPLIEQHVDKLLSELRAGRATEAILLVNSQTGTRWFQRAHGAATSFCLPQRRIRFLRPSGEPGPHPRQAQTILYFGAHPDRFDRHFRALGNVTTIRREGAA